MLSAVLSAISILFALGVAGVALPRRLSAERRGGIVYGGSALACGLAALGAGAFLAGTPQPLEVILPIGLPWLPSRLRLDGLSAAFLLIVNTVGLLTSVYGIGYGRHERHPFRVLPFFPVFLAGLSLVPLADDAFTFLVAWEFMSVSSWLLVLSTHRQQATRRAAMVYLVMAAFGTAMLIVSFSIMADGADLSFAAIRAREWPEGMAGLAVLFMMLGAGSKAGVVPLHAWLPLAHPAAPTHVSALMSGAMTKVALYAMVRVLFDLVGHGAWWWGLLIIAVGAATAVMGVLYAVVQRDLKTLLAYSTVENVGVMVIGIGLAVAFQANGQGTPAGLALLATLFHAVNHALYKALLFLGAGVVVSATGHRDLERMGGLIHRLPVTTVAFLIGSMAIAALPPLNGFASEWLLFQAVLSGTGLPQWGLKLAVPVAGALLALATAVAAACFVRAFAIAFLGRPRSPEAATAVESPRSMTVPLAIMAGACIVFGALPAAVLSPLVPVVENLMGAPPLAAGGAHWVWLTPVAERASSYGGVVFLVAVGSMALLMLAVRRLAPHRVRRSHAWDCGFGDSGVASQYTASSFSQPIRRVFGGIFSVREEVEMPEPGETSAARFTLHDRDPVWHWLYRPIGGLIGWVTERGEAAQFLTIRHSLSVMFAALVALLVVVVLVR